MGEEVPEGEEGEAKKGEGEEEEEMGEREELREEFEGNLNSDLWVRAELWRRRRPSGREGGKGVRKGND